MPDLSGLKPGSLVLLQGNEAIARGALEAGVRFAAAYPGNPSSEILQVLAESAESAGIYAEWSVNEKVALEAAAAAAFAGLRAMASMKQNGVNVASDFITNLSLSGSGPGGLVLVTADDPGSISSTNEEDARFIAKLADLPLLEPSTPTEALDMIKFAFDLSEQVGTLVVFRSISRLSHTRAGVTPGAMPGEAPHPYWDPNRAMGTMPAVFRHGEAKERLVKAGELMAAAGFNRYTGPDQPELTVIASGSSFLYAEEAVELMGLGGRVGLLKLGCTWPLDEKLLAERLAVGNRFLFLEEVDPFIEDAVSTLYAGLVPKLGVKHLHGRHSGQVPLVGELTPGKVAAALADVMQMDYQPTDPAYIARAAELAAGMVPPREVGFCPGCPHRASYWSMKQVLAVDGRDGLVSGDIGCYSLGRLATGFHRVNSVHCMGSGPGISSGLGKLGQFGFDQPVISVVGDSTFYHAALPALVNARWNRSNYVLVVLDNSATAMTGFQPHPGTGRTAGGGEGVQVDVEQVCRGLGLDYQVVDPYDLAAAQEALYDAVQSKDEMKVLIFRRVCALVQNKRGGHPYRMEVDADACRGGNCGCNRFCSRVFKCPGLTFDPEKNQAVLDEVVCVGCGVCAQVCPAGAIKAIPRDQEAAA